jgi:predicted CopG family antitoxin
MSNFQGAQTKTITFRLDNELAAALDKAKGRLSLSDVIRLNLEKSLKAAGLLDEK